MKCPKDIKNLKCIEKKIDEPFIQKSGILIKNHSVFPIKGEIDLHHKRINTNENNKTV